jgi:predicted small lipoprotein YifL
MRQRVLFFLLGVMAILSAGCGRRGPLDVPEGCASGDAVPQAVRTAVETAAQQLFDQARRNDWTGIYDHAAKAVREQGTRQAFLAPLTRTFQELGVASHAETDAITVVKFGSKFTPTGKVVCGEAKRPLELIVSPVPLQASLVQKAPVGAEQFFFSTLWHGEEGEWRLAALFAKPATLLGRDWRSFAQQARTENQAGNRRNAALLYNAAIDLVLPNAWTEPPEIKDLQRDQSRISVSDLPKQDVPVTWYAPPDSFRVHAIGYGITQNDLVLVVRYEAIATLADTVAQARDADRLRRYLDTKFPEYAKVFRFLALEAFDTRNREQTWSKLGPLRPPS